MRILYQFPLSHFCEKARWMLDYKELEYVAQNLMPGAHRARGCRSGKTPWAKA